MQWKCVIAEEQRAPRGRGKERSKMGRMERGWEQKDGKRGEEEGWGGKRLREVGREGKGGKGKKKGREGMTGPPRFQYVDASMVYMMRKCTERVIFSS